MKSILLIDNYDSFTYMLADYVMQCGVECKVILNNDQELLQIRPEDFLALVISPGPGIPGDAGLLMDVLPRFMKAIPVLGICLGHQAIGCVFGAELVPALIPRHGKTDTLHQNGHSLFKGVPEYFQATRYHSLVLKNLPEILESQCNCGEEIMAIKHRQLPVYGVQFHPESCQTPDGFRIVLNFVEEACKLASVKFPYI